MKSILLRLYATLTTLVWGAFAITLLYIWISTLRQHQKSILLFVFFEMLLLLLLYLVAGFEIAYTDLRDKDPEQIDDDIRETFNNIKRDEDVLYESREWLGVLLVAALAAMCEFTPVFEPAFLIGDPAHPHVDPATWKIIFTLLFTTVPVVWIAQSPAKTLAILNSQRLFRRCRYIWYLLEPLGIATSALGFGSLTKLMYGVTARRWRTSKRNLRPSGPAFYVAALKRYGYGLQALRETLSISDSGAVEVIQEGTLHVVSADRKVFVRELFYDSSVYLSGDIEVLDAFQIPVPAETDHEIEEQIAKCGVATLPDGYKRLTPSEFERSQLNDDNGKHVSFQIAAGRALASAPNISNGRGNGYSTVIRYRIRALWGPGAFTLNEHQKDYYRLRAIYPVRSFSFTISLAETTGRRFANLTPSVMMIGNEHLEEQSKVFSKFQNEDDYQTTETTVTYPLAGPAYGVIWDIWKI